MQFSSRKMSLLFFKILSELCKDFPQKFAILQLLKPKSKVCHDDTLQSVLRYSAYREFILIRDLQCYMHFILQCYVHII